MQNQHDVEISIENSNSRSGRFRMTSNNINYAQKGAKCGIGAKPVHLPFGGMHCTDFNHAEFEVLEFRIMQILTQNLHYAHFQCLEICIIENLHNAFSPRTANALFFGLNSA